MRRLLLIIPLLVAVIFLSGYRSPEEVGDMLRDLQSKATAGDAEALYWLSTIYEHGFDTIPRDSVKAMELLTRSAEDGWLPAQNYLGYTLIQEGKGEEGIAWLERAAIAGDAKAQSNLGFLLLDDGKDDHALKRGIVADNEKAAFWLERAALGGVATASSMLGDLYRDGRGVAQDSTQAAACYYAAINSGLADAAYKLEAMKGKEWAALPAQEQLPIALYFYTHRAPDIAVSIFNRLAEDPACDPAIRGAALALLGDAYTRASGVAYDYDKSLDYYYRAAELGNAPAQFVISELLEIFPDALDTLSPTPPSAQQLREAAAAAGIETAEEATIRLMNPVYHD